MDALSISALRKFVTKAGVGLLLTQLVNCAADKGPQTVSSPQSKGVECTKQAVQRSFLLQWKTSVPLEFLRYQIGHTLVTKFVDIDKSYIEVTILKNYGGQVILAEHEFKVRDLSMKSVDATANEAWGVADTGVKDAWNLLGIRGDGISVAVIDSGFDTSHSLLSSQLYVNPNEIPGNSIDDDGNGLVDDVSGWNFADKNNDLSDSVEHGTHVSGVIAGKEDAATGFIGMAPGAKILPLKFIGADFSGEIGDALAAIEYATKMGARVINASWGGPQCSDTLQSAIFNATSHGTVFVTASGNSGHDLAAQPEWPAAYSIPGKLSIGAHNKNQFLAWFSNFGQLVELSAPGEHILSTLPSNRLGYKDGTSMAAPFVSGIAALLLSYKPSMTTVDITKLLNDSVQTGNFNVKSKGKISAIKAAQMLK